MQKIKLIFLFLSSIAWALPVGNPAEPALLSSPGEMTLRLGYSNETVAPTALVSGSWTQTAKWMTNTGQLTINLLGRLDAFVTLGVSNLRTKPTEVSATLPADGNANACLAIRTFPAATYGYGFRAIIFKFLGLHIAAESQLVQSNPKPFFSTAGKVNKLAEEQSLHFKQRQIGLAASYTVPFQTIFTPYAGIRWQKITLDFQQLTPPASLGGEFKDLQEQSPWGNVIGVAIIGKQRWSVSSEANLWNQRSFSLTAQLRY